MSEEILTEMLQYNPGVFEDTFDEFRKEIENGGIVSIDRYRFTIVITNAKELEDYKTHLEQTII
jgi:hypothetical protein